MINTTISKYKITRLIGQGGMATVYEAEHEMLGTKAAIKVLNPILSANDQIRERFRNEAKMMASLDHPNITKVIDFDEQPQQLSIIMEFLNGEDLNDMIKRKGALSENEIQNIFTQTLSACQYAHEKGIVHRDIKPSNIFILPNGHVKILDFGIAKLFGQGNEMTQTGAQMGTPIYMSPEQVKADKSIDHRSDIYSLGVTMFYAINGKPPYNAETDSQFDIFTKIVYEPLPEFSVQSKFNELVLRACQKDRQDRFQSCEEFFAANNSQTYINSDYKAPNKTISKDNSINHEESINDLKKTNSNIFALISNWIIRMNYITLISGLLALTGAIHQFYQFENHKDFDLSYIGAFSAWISLLTGLLSLLSILVSISKKIRYTKSLISFLISVSAFWLLNTTLNEYRNFWKPLWNSHYKSWDISDERKKDISDGWKFETITIDSLKSLEKKYKKY
jgi:serine/threonine-protein kinase